MSLKRFFRCKRKQVRKLLKIRLSNIQDNYHDIGTLFAKYQSLYSHQEIKVNVKEHEGSFEYYYNAVSIFRVLSNFKYVDGGFCHECIRERNIVPDELTMKFIEVNNFFQKPCNHQFKNFLKNFGIPENLELTRTVFLLTEKDLEDFFYNLYKIKNIVIEEISVVQKYLTDDEISYL